MEQILYTWSFEDSKNRSPLWYSIAFAIIIGLVIWWFLTAQYGLSFILLLITGLAYFIENNSDDIVTVSIHELGIQVWEWFYDFAKISSCSYIYEWSNAILMRIVLHKKWFRFIDIPVNNEQVTDIKNILQDKIPESGEAKLSLGQKILRKIKL